MELLIDRELVITPQRLERIHQAVMFYADSVNLRITSEVLKKNAEIVTRLRELQEIGAVNTWAHEYEVDDGGRVRQGQWESVLAGPANQVLPLQQVKELVEGVDADLNITDNPDDSSTLREGIAELVQFRQSVIGFRLADALAAEGLLTSRNYTSTLGGGVVFDMQSGEQYGSIVETIVELCTFRNLSQMPLEAIIDCRSHMPAFRRYLQEKLAQSTDRDPRHLAQQIVSEYHDLLMRYSKSHEIRDLATDIGWDVVGALLPPTVFVKYVGKPIEWSKRRREFRPFLLLSQIRTQQRR